MQPKSLGELLDALKKLAPEELEKPMIYISDSLSISGIVSDFGKAKANLYWDCGDDPSELKTKKEWREDGYDDEDIEEFELYVQKGDFVIKF